MADRMTEEDIATLILALGVREKWMGYYRLAKQAISHLLHDRDEARACAVGLQARLEGYMEGAEIGRAMAVGDRNPDGNDFAAFGRCPSCGESVREVL